MHLHKPQDRQAVGIPHQLLPTISVTLWVFVEPDSAVGKRLGAFYWTVNIIRDLSLKGTVILTGDSNYSLWKEYILSTISIAGILKLFLGEAWEVPMGREK